MTEDDEMKRAEVPAVADPKTTELTVSDDDTDVLRFQTETLKLGQGKHPSQSHQCPREVCLPMFAEVC